MTPAPFSKDIEYEKPEQPPPTTPIRSPAGSGLCWAMISFTLETAFSVSITGALGVVSTLGVDVVAIVIVSLSLRVRSGAIIHSSSLIPLILPLDDFGRAWVAGIPCRCPAKNLDFCPDKRGYNCPRFLMPRASFGTLVA